MRRSSERIAPLSVLPLFVDVRGRRALVAGDGDGAAWKTELLAAAGANVDVYATTPGDTLRELLATTPPAGSWRLRGEAWSAKALRGATLAVIDTDDDAEADAFVAAARASGAIANAIDRPRPGCVQFGSIVNRSPLVIGISSTGAAPMLAQAIRRRIETVIPAALAGWGALAARLRPRVVARHAAGAARRRFWSAFVEKAFTSTCDARASDHFDRMLETDESDARCGRVSLVGAGPGDSGHLTLEALRVLGSADVILFDDLVSSEVLELARREAKRMLVGKRGRRTSCKQSEINALMCKLARQGKHVVRLKGGDPGVFGRVGEELRVLHEAGIEATVVPGVTAASAMAARFGVSLTHRDRADCLRLVTGHSRHGELPQGLGARLGNDARATTIVYMGARTGPALARRLLANGVEAATPAVAATAVSRPDEHVWTGTLLALAEGRANYDAEQPVLLGIGQVFRDAQASPSRARRRSGVQPDGAGERPRRLKLPRTA